MANQYVAPVPASQVGSYFVQQYYQVFRQQREYVYQFYNESSSMMRIDGDNSISASDMMQIHQVIMSLNFTEIEMKTIKSLESWNRGVLVVVSGSVRSRNFSGSRKFVQTFFLAPQKKGYYVLNDMFHFSDEELPQQPSIPLADEENIDYHPTMSTHLPDRPASNYRLEDEAVDYLNSVHIGGGEPVVEYSYHNHYQHESEREPEHEHEHEPKSELEPEPEPEDVRLQEETPLEDSSVLLQNTVTTVQEPQPSPEEPTREPEKLTYASILRAKRKPSPSISVAVFTPNTTPASDWGSLSQPSLPQSAPSLPNPGVDTVEEASLFEEGESQSVYVRNLPSTVTSLDILQEFMNFGKVKHDGVFLRNRMDTSVCYAFVEFEDVQSVQNAIKASPIQLAGRQVYIEERRQNTGASSRGGRSSGRGGRGRGGGRGRSFGRGSEQNGGFYSKGRTSGFRT